MKKQSKLKTMSALIATVSLGSVATSQATLVAHWTFDSDFTADAGGSNYDLTPENGATAGDVAGQFGNAADFDRAASQYAFTGGDVLSPGADYTYSAWYNMNVDDITGSDRYFVLETSAGDTPSGTGAWTASIGLRETGGDVAQIFTHPSTAVGTVSYVANMWNHIAVTFDADGGTTGGIINAYLNGSATPFATLDDVATSTAVGGLVIGGHRAGTGRNFDGQIDDVAFWDNVLSTAEIQSLQTNTANNVIPEPSGTVLLSLGMLAFVMHRRK
ncbi:LamG domain-containing protein [Akkermansiaceae bacterium]|nr:LamG domain-containing protein [Akkermansiaceae bacterium]